MLNAVEKVLFLLHAPATALATTDALSRLASIAQEAELDVGEQLFSPGDPTDAMFVLLDGAVRIDGADDATRLCGVGEFVGGLALFAGDAHAVTATAVVSTRVLRFDRADLHDVLDEDGELARALFSGLVRTLRPAALSAAVG